MTNVNEKTVAKTSSSSFKRRTDNTGIDED